MSAPIERLLSVEEVAKILGTPISSTYAYVRKLGIPYVKVGRHFRVPEGALQAWIARNAKPDPPPIERNVYDPPPPPRRRMAADMTVEGIVPIRPTQPRIRKNPPKPTEK